MEQNQMQSEKEEEQNNTELRKMEGLKEVLSNVILPMYEDTLKERPKDIANFMINYLRDKYGYSSSGLQYEEKKELEKLRNEVENFRDMDEHAYYAEMQKQVKKEIKVSEKKGKNPPKPKPRLPPDEIIVSDDEDYNDPEEIDQNLDNVEYIKEFNENNKRVAVSENCVPDDEDLSVKTFKKNNELIEFMRINLMKSPLFSELSMDVLKRCIDSMEEKSYSAVTDVVKQGEIGDNFFFVLEGELECRIQFTKITKEGNRKRVEKFEPKLVKIYGPGDYFGELSLLYHTPRRGTIRAATDVKLYTLNRSTYKKILTKANTEKIARKINIFKKVPILEVLTDEEFLKLQEISKEATYYKGETIIKENEFSNVMLILEKGKCIGTLTKEKGKLPLKNSEYNREGIIIGEGALLKPEKRQENIIAVTDVVKFLCLDRFSFKQNFGSLEQMLMRNMELYFKFFPPIEEKEEKKKEKEENDKNINTLLVSQAQSPNQNPNTHQNSNQLHSNEQIKQHDSNTNMNNNLTNTNINNSNTVVIEEITKKVKEEAEEEKKQIIKQYDEEMEKLKQEVANLLNEKEKLKKENEEKEQIILNNQNMLLISQNNMEKQNLLQNEQENNEVAQNNNDNVDDVDINQDNQNNNENIQMEQERDQVKEEENNNNINNNDINNNNEDNNNNNQEMIQNNINNEENQERKEEVVDNNDNIKNNNEKEEGEKEEENNKEEENKKEEENNKEEKRSNAGTEVELMKDLLEYNYNDLKPGKVEVTKFPDFLEDFHDENNVKENNVIQEGQVEQIAQ